MSTPSSGGAKDPAAPSEMEAEALTAPPQPQDSPDAEPPTEPATEPGVGAEAVTDTDTGADAVQSEGSAEPNAWTVDDAESTAVTVAEAEPEPGRAARLEEPAPASSEDDLLTPAVGEQSDAEEPGPDQPDEGGGAGESVAASAATDPQAEPAPAVPVVERPSQAEASADEPDHEPDQPELEPDHEPEHLEPDQPEGSHSDGDSVLPGATPHPGPTLTGWAAVTAAVRPHPATRGQLLAGVLCAVLGFALVVQVHQVNTSGLSALRQADLVQVLARVTGESARLEEEAAGLAQAREKLANGDVDRAAAQASARQRLQVLAILAGTAPARGPGLRVTITDPKGRVGAAEVLDAVQELRDAGAEAMQIEGGGRQVRIVASTSFVDADGGLRMGGAVVHAPFTVRVLGDPDTLAAALKIPGGVDDVLRGLGCEVSVTAEQDLLVSALATPVQYRYSRPAG